MRNLEFFINIAIERGGKCLSTEYKSCKEPMLWECSRGHRWKATADKIMQKRWCHICGGSKRKDIVWCCNLAEAKGGKCLSVEYKNCEENVLWECKNGHKWEATPNNVRRKTWCPECKKEKYRLTQEEKIKCLEECCSIAQLKGGKCLSSEYKKSGKRMLWECSKGHQWETTPNCVKRGSWCRICSRLEAAKKMNFTCILQHWKTGEGLVCQGSYEKKVVEYFNLNTIDFQWQPKVFTLPSGKTYHPDCYICGTDKWIEIKGYFWDDAKAKWDWFHKEYPNSELWNQKKLEEMNILTKKAHKE